MPRWLLFDCETSDIGPGSKMVELAWFEVDEDLNILEEVHTRLDPQVPISPGASGVHNLTNEDLVDEPTVEQFFSIIRPGKVSGDVVMIAHNCVPGDTEVLTPDGWLPIGMYLTTTKVREVMQWDPKTGRLSWATPSAFIAGSNPELVVWDSLYHQGAYTPEHRMFFHPAGKESWSVETAGELAERGPNSTYLPVSGVFDSQGSKVLGAALSRFLEAVRADGSWHHNKGGPPSVRFSLKKTRKIERILELAEALGLEPKIAKRRTDEEILCISFKRHTAIDEAFKILGQQKRYTLSVVLGLSFSDRCEILEESKFWDGHVQGSSHSVSTADKEEAEAFQLMAHLSGWSARVSVQRNDRGFSSACPHDLYRVRLRKRSKVKLLGPPERKRNGGDQRVYCVTVPAGAFLMRRNGIVNITGNSSFDEKYFRPWCENMIGTIDTLRLARRFMPTAANHKLATLKYEFNLGRDTAHSALGDVKTLYRLTQLLVEKSGMRLPELFIDSAKPLVVHLMPFGKHKGVPMQDLPVPYLGWLSTLTDADPDLIYTAKKVLKEKTG